MNLPTRSTGGSPSLLLAEASGPASPLLLLHGLSRTHEDFATVSERLAPSWRLVGIDHRGHGRSERAERYLVVDYVADAVRVLRDVLRSPVVILGHSLGAMVAAAVAAALPEFVRGLVLADPPFHTMGDRIAGTPWQAQFLGMRAVATDRGPIDAVAAATAEIRLPQPGGGTIRLGDIRDPAAIRWSAECLMALDPAVFTPVIEGHWLEDYDPFAIAGAIRCPIRLLQGDPAVGGTLTDADARRFSAAAERCTVERFSGTGHQLHWLQPDRLCAAVAAVAADASDQTAPRPPSEPRP